MLAYDSFRLPNGLRVITHQVPHSQVALFNIMYKVGSGNEKPTQTGIAHLLEHLMFSRSKNVPNYDKALQKVGGQNNAYTTFDVTNYYCILPVANLETAFWLESDRMYHLACDESHLEVQRKVVIEEFNQTCFNKPYGDLWHHLLPMAYRNHGYSWPTIGKNIKQIENISLADIHAFAKRFYTPDNAVIVVAGGVTANEVKKLSEKWFDQGAPSLPQYHNTTLQPQQQKKGLRKKVHGKVPFNLLLHAYHIPPRQDKAFLSLSLLAHLLGSGKSSLLYEKLVHELHWLTDVSVDTLDTLSGGLFLIEAELNDNTTFAQVEDAIYRIIDTLCHNTIDTSLWEKAKNQLESEYAFTHMSLFDRADTLAFSTWVESPNFFNIEISNRLHALEAKKMQEDAIKYLQKKEAIVLSYSK